MSLLQPLMLMMTMTHVELKGFMLMLTHFLGGIVNLVCCQITHTQTNWINENYVLIYFHQFIWAIKCERFTRKICYRTSRWSINQVCFHMQCLLHWLFNEREWFYAEHYVYTTTAMFYNIFRCLNVLAIRGFHFLYTDS